MNAQIEKRVRKAVNVSGFVKQFDRFVSLHATVNNLLDTLSSLFERVEKIAGFDGFGEEWSEFPNLQNLLIGKLVAEIEGVNENIRITM
jgi:hypothetical protein